MERLRERSFNDLKVAFTNATLLAFPDYKLPFVMYTGASALDIGAVLMEQEVHGKHHTVTYASRTLNQAESNYFGISS